MWCDLAQHLGAQELLHAFFHDVATGGRRDGLDLFSGAFVVTRKQRQGCELLARITIECGDTLAGYFNFAVQK